jgi:hypothetical protein
MLFQFELPDDDPDHPLIHPEVRPAGLAASKRWRAVADE